MSSIRMLLAHLVTPAVFVTLFLLEQPLGMRLEFPFPRDLFLFGYYVALVASLVIGGPINLLMLRFGCRSPLLFAFMGSALAVLSFSLFGLSSGADYPFMLVAAQVAGPGAVAGAVFWLIGYAGTPVKR